MKTYSSKGGKNQGGRVSKLKVRDLFHSIKNQKSTKFY